MTASSNRSRDDRSPRLAAEDGGCILIVGDPEDSARFVESLRGTGYVLLGPHNGEDVREVVGSGRAIGAAVIDVDHSIESYDVVWQLAELEYPCRSILLGSEIDESTVREAFLAGVIGCFPKPVSPSILHAALRNAIDGTRIARACLREQPTLRRRTLPTSDRLGELTEREREVLDLILAGCPTRQMSRRLGVTERTVKYHVANILRKLGASSRIALLAKFRSELTLGS